MKEKFASFMKGLASLAVIPLVVIGIDLIGFLTGGLLTGAVVSGVALVLSCFFVTLNFSDSTRTKFYRIIGKRVGWIDMIQTIVLTYVGFHLGVNMGLCLLIVGLNVSMYLCLVRVGRIICDKDSRTEFWNEVREPQAVAA